MYLYKVNKPICNDNNKIICNNEEMKEYSDRLKYALAIRELSQSDLARAVGVKPQAIQYLCEKGKRSVHSVKISEVLKINARWLTDGIGDMELCATPKPEKQPGQGSLQAVPPGTEYVPIRVGNFRLQAGVNGFMVDYLDDSLAPLFFREDWLRRNNLKADKLVACQVMGESMEPRLYAGDTVLINTADNEPKDSAVFAVNYEGELVIKRLVRDAGQWWLSSDNADKVSYPNKLCSGDLCLLIGKVVHRQSTRI